MTLILTWVISFNFMKVHSYEHTLLMEKVFMTVCVGAYGTILVMFIVHSFSRRWAGFTLPFKWALWWMDWLVIVLRRLCTINFHWMSPVLLDFLLARLHLCSDHAPESTSGGETALVQRYRLIKRIYLASTGFGRIKLPSHVFWCRYKGTNLLYVFLVKKFVFGPPAVCCKVV